MLDRYFFEGNSIIHRLDPRVKVVLTVVFALGVAFSNSYLLIYFSIFYSLVIIFIAKIPVHIAFKRLLPLIIFLLLLWVFLPLSVKGKTIFEVGPLAITKEGVLYAYRITAKSVAILLLLIAFITTSNMVALFHALAHLKVPKKLIFLIFFTYRYIHVVWMEYQRIKNALAMRCFVPGTNLHTYKTVAHVVGMLMVRSYDRSERVYNAMLCRGFNGTFYMLDHFELKGFDIIFTAISIIIFSGVVWISANQIL